MAHSKIGRDKVKGAAYKAKGTRAVNKARKIAKHVKRHPSDAQAQLAIDPASDEWAGKLISDWERNRVGRAAVQARVRSERAEADRKQDERKARRAARKVAK